MQRSKPKWYKLIVDGKLMDVWPSSKSTQKRMRLSHLRGIKIEDATREERKAFLKKEKERRVQVSARDAGDRNLSLLEAIIKI